MIRRAVHGRWCLKNGRGDIIRCRMKLTHRILASCPSSLNWRRFSRNNGTVLPHWPVGSCRLYYGLKRVCFGRVLEGNGWEALSAGSRVFYKRSEHRSWQLSITQPVRVAVCVTDSCQPLSRADWPAEWLTAVNHSARQSGRRNDWQLSITQPGIRACAESASLWANDLQNKRLTIHTGNESLEAIINKPTSKHSVITSLVRRLVATCMQNNMHIRAKQIPDKFNTTADLLSQIERFRKEAP